MTRLNVYVDWWLLPAYVWGLMLVYELVWIAVAAGINRFRAWWAGTRGRSTADVTAAAPEEEPVPWPTPPRDYDRRWTPKQ